MCQCPLPCHTHPQFCWLTPEICLPPRVIRASAFPIRAQPSVTWSSGGFHAGQRREEAAGGQTTLGGQQRPSPAAKDRDRGLEEGSAPLPSPTQSGEHGFGRFVVLLLRNEVKLRHIQSTTPGSPSSPEKSGRRRGRRRGAPLAAPLSTAIVVAQS